MGLEPGYPVATSTGSQAVTVYDGNFQPIDSFPGDGYHVNITCQTTGSDGVEYYRLLSSEWEGNTTNVAYVVASSVQVTSNPWETMPRCGNLNGCLRKSAAGVAIAGAVGVVGVAIARRRSRTSDE